MLYKWNGCFVLFGVMFIKLDFFEVVYVGKNICCDLLYYYNFWLKDVEKYMFILER